jgi:hypothetical protein
MIMPSGLRKFALVAHVATSVGSLGAVAGFLVLALVGVAGGDAQRVRGADLAMEVTAWFAIVPLVFAALLTGLVQSLGTNWGLFRHYWVLAKLLLTIFTAVVLFLQLEGISYVASVAAERTSSGSDLAGLRTSLRLHATGGLVVLLILVGLSIYKPRGLTRHGWRKQYGQR